MNEHTRSLEWQRILKDQKETGVNFHNSFHAQENCYDQVLERQSLKKTPSHLHNYLKGKSYFCANNPFQNADSWMTLSVTRDLQ